MVHFSGDIRSFSGGGGGYLIFLDGFETAIYSNEPPQNLLLSGCKFRQYYPLTTGTGCMTCNTTGIKYDILELYIVQIFIYKFIH